MFIASSAEFPCLRQFRNYFLGVLCDHTTVSMMSWKTFFPAGSGKKVVSPSASTFAISNRNAAHPFRYEGWRWDLLLLFSKNWWTCLVTEIRWSKHNSWLFPETTRHRYMQGPAGLVIKMSMKKYGEIGLNFFVLERTRFENAAKSIIQKKENHIGLRPCQALPYQTRFLRIAKHVYMINKDTGCWSCTHDQRKRKRRCEGTSLD